MSTFCDCIHSFSLKAGEKSCNPCPQGAECLGGAEIIAKQGFWRELPNSTSFHTCLRREACEGYPKTEQCAEGYEGIMCSSCKLGYASGSGHSCSKCMVPAARQSLLIISLLVVAAVVALFVRSTLRNAANEERQDTMLMKILLTHLQTVSLAAGFDLAWPPALVNFLGGLDSASSLSDNMISLGCEFESGRFFWSTLAFLTSPLMLTVGCGVVWAVMWVRGRRERREAMDGFVVSTIALLFLLHPSLCRKVFLLFTCRRVDDVSRLLADLEIECGNGSQLVWMLGLGLPALIVYVTGIPAAALGLLRKSRDELDEEREKGRLGFLYLGFRRECYYWEVVIMARKVSCAD